MKVALTSFISGVVFALGLGISGMTRPIKVIGFLDFFGNWDASLAFVMLGAIGVYFVAYRLSRTMRSPILAPGFSIPTSTVLDTRLIIGAALFGAGWGLSGFCPGPAITSLASGAAPVVVFVASMVAGIYLHGWFAQLEFARSGERTRIVQHAADA
ncbi:MAG: DUF6691 family protein [Candidatus Binatus sp.]